MGLSIAGKGWLGKSGYVKVSVALSYDHQLSTMLCIESVTGNVAVTCNALQPLFLLALAKTKYSDFRTEPRYSNGSG